MLNRTIVFLMLIFLVSASYAKLNSYLVAWDILSVESRQVLVNILNVETDGQYSQLRCYVFNSTDSESSTRLIAKCNDKIEQNETFADLQTAGIVQKIIETEDLYSDGIWSVKRTVLFDYLHSATSWYDIIMSSK